MKRATILLAAMLLPRSAWALELGVALGSEATINDPFVQRVGPGLRLLVAPREGLEVALHGAICPRFGDPDHKALTTELIEEFHVAPDISLIRHRLDSTLALYPLAGGLGDWQRRAGVYAGMGLVHTWDDLEVVGAYDQPEWLATEDQWHVATVYGLAGELRREALGVGLRMERQHYTEVVGTEYLETKKTTWLAVEVSWRFALPRE